MLVFLRAVGGFSSLTTALELVRPLLLRLAVGLELVAVVTEDGSGVGVRSLTSAAPPRFEGELARGAGDGVGPGELPTLRRFLFRRSAIADKGESAW